MPANLPNTPKPVIVRPPVKTIKVPGPKKTPTPK